MKNSIIFKTSFIIVLLQIIILSAIGVYIQNSQINIIDELQTNQKNYITTKLNNIEKEAIKKELDILNVLLSSVNGAISDTLYNVDKDSANITIEKFINKDNIKAVYIYDSSSGEIFSVVYKKDKKIIFSDSLPSDFTRLNYIKSDLFMNDENLGYMKVYYNNEKIIKDISALKEKDLTLFEKQSLEIGEKVKKEFFYQVISFTFGGLMTVLLIIFLLRRFVNEPLILFQNGLISFFDYLKDPSKKVNSIDINTTDEFGQMTKSVNESIEVSMKMHGEMAQLMHNMDKNVITSETDNDGIITYVSQAFCDISGYSKEELIGKSHSIMRHPDMGKSIFNDLWKTIKDNKTWEGEVKNLKKDGSFYWVHAIISPKCTKSGGSCGFTAIRYDITDKKEVEDLTQNLEIRIEERTKELELAKENVEQILANILLPVLITSKEKRTISYANKFAHDLYETSQEDIIDSEIDSVYTLTNGPEGIIKQIKESGRVDSLEEHITTSTGKEFIGLLSVAPITYNDEECYIGMTVDITKQKDMENEVRAIHKHTRDSIEYASLIQGAVVSQKEEMFPYFKDSFVHWVPKDTVGGDIWLFNDLRHEDECLLFFIDCTGHGVPGAFVTMIVKAVEREITAKIKDDLTMDISPAWIMSYFNKTTKILLKQETKDSISNAGWDGGVIYYNRRQQILKFAGAETPLFYMTQEGELKTIKGNRYSVGYKKCAMDYEYKETILEVKEGMKFYCTTDGYLDQNGGEKDFPFGKKRFTNIIKDNHTIPMEEQKTIFINEMEKYETAIENNDRNDDMTVIAFEIGKQSEFKEDKIVEIVKYEGVMTQNVIAAAMDNIESKISNIGIMGTVSTITIEYCQNMMNYSKNEDIDSRQIVPAGTIEVQYINDEYYDIIATNIVSKEDKEKIEPKLIEIQGLDKQGIKKRYRELRKSGQNTHEKGGGIGMYEIAKVSDSIEYEFTAINEDKYYFMMKSFVKPKIREKKE